MNAHNRLKLESALRQLMRSERGQACLQGLESFLEHSCFSLDSSNQAAVIWVANAFFDSGHETLNAIREALS